MGSPTDFFIVMVYKMEMNKKERKGGIVAHCEGIRGFSKGEEMK